MKEHVFAQAINSVLRDNKNDRYVGNKKRGKLDFDNLARIGYSDKVFKKKEARKNKDYSVLILCDRSGSMGGHSNKDSFWGASRSDVVRDSIEFLTDSLNKTDIQFAVWSFGNVVLTAKDFGERTPGSVVANRYAEHMNVRAFTCDRCRLLGVNAASISSVCSSCGHMADNIGNGGNVDGLALHLALEEIHTKKGEKIIIVLSDGEADAYHSTCSQYSYMKKDGVKYGAFPVKEVVKKVIKDGVILCSIGIQNSAVQKIYPKSNTRVVSDLNMVCKEIINLIKPRIKRG